VVLEETDQREQIILEEQGELEELEELAVLVILADSLGITSMPLTLFCLPTL